MSAAPDYDGAAVVAALRELGLKRGDIVFSTPASGCSGAPPKG